MKIGVNDKIIICDLDGCLVETSWIWDINRELKLQAPQCWELFENNANSSWNKVDSFLEALLTEKIKQGYKLFFITARSKAIEKETIKHIEQKTTLKHNIDFGIYFRNIGDFSEPWECKQNILDVVFDKKQIVLAIDDDKRIVEMYKQNGINAIRWQFGFIPAEIITEFVSVPSISLKLEVK